MMRVLVRLLLLLLLLLLFLMEMVGVVVIIVVVVVAAVVVTVFDSAFRHENPVVSGFRRQVKVGVIVQRTFGAKEDAVVVHAAGIAVDCVHAAVVVVFVVVVVVVAREGNVVKGLVVVEIVRHNVGPIIKVTDFFFFFFSCVKNSAIFFSLRSLSFVLNVFRIF